MAFALLDKSGKAVQVQVDENCEPSVWTGSKSFDYKTDFTVKVPAGDYVWAVAIVNTEKDNTPAIELATRGELSADKWLKVAEVIVK